MKKYNEKYWSMFCHSSRIHKHFLGLRSRQPALQRKLRSTTHVVFIFFTFLFFVGALVFAGWIDTSLWEGNFIGKLQKNTQKILEDIEFPLICANESITQTCPNNYPNTTNFRQTSNSTCPEYFRWIHEDLRPWKETGITREMINKAQGSAHFRLVIVNGKAHIEKYKQSIQTRDMFTLWGILQLLRFYPGKLPDLELIFDCDDRPVVQSKHFSSPDSGPPPLFRYCSDDRSLDIVFPDWSFWGWAETNIRPWGDILKDIKEGNKRTKWKDRVPYAYWKGNPHVASTRRDLLRCNVSEKDDWNTRLYIQDWIKESEVGYKQSKLEDQCTHRYKIYIEGWAWSVSEKYILACDSMTLYVTPRYYDFFMRGMVPLQHYWPIKDNNKCPSLKHAVAWGNNNTQKAQEIGESASSFIHNDMKMEYVYDYMFNLLSEYAKLLKFKPVVPPSSVELCSEKMACWAEGNWKKFMVESLVKSPSDLSPCTLPPPYDPMALKSFLDRKGNSTRQVEVWENEYWEGESKEETIKPVFF